MILRRKRESQLQYYFWRDQGSICETHSLLEQEPDRPYLIRNCPRPNLKIIARHRDGSQMVSLQVVVPCLQSTVEYLDTSNILPKTPKDHRGWVRAFFLLCYTVIQYKQLFRLEFLMKIDHVLFKLWERQSKKKSCLGLIWKAFSNTESSKALG